MARTYNTLFMLMSIDGKIATGIGERDIDLDSPNIESLKKGRFQYDSLELMTDVVSLNTGKVMAKMGWNKSKKAIDKIPVDFVIVDNKPHLTKLGIENLIIRTKKLYIVTTNKDHPARQIASGELEVIFYENKIDFTDLFSRLKNNGVERVTVQSGGTLNAELIRSDLIDELNVVMAPIIIGGKDTSTLVDGQSPSTVDEIAMIQDFDLLKVEQLKESFLHLMYKRKKV